VDWKPIGDHFAIGARYRYSAYGTNGVSFLGTNLSTSFRADQHAADNQFTIQGSLFLF